MAKDPRQDWCLTFLWLLLENSSSFWAIFLAASRRLVLSLLGNSSEWVHTKRYTLSSLFTNKKPLNSHLCQGTLSSLTKYTQIYHFIKKRQSTLNNWFCSWVDYQQMLPTRRATLFGIFPGLDWHHSASRIPALHSII